MKSIIAALFTIYSVTESSANSRLLLQVPPAYVPAASAPGAGAGAGAGTTGAPAATAGPVNPAIPANPATPANPAIPTAPATTAAAAPGTTVWSAPILPSAGPGQGVGAGGIFECVLPNTDPMGCAGRMTAFENPGQNFKVKCSNVGACAASTIDFTYGAGSYTERVEQLLFSEPYAGYAATIVMDSSLSPVNQYIDKLECKAPQACMDLSVELFGGASVNDIDCAYGNYCPNCSVKICEWLPSAQAPNRVKQCGTPKPCFRF